MAGNTQGIGYFTAENIVAVLRAVPQTDGTYAEVVKHAREYDAGSRSTRSASGFRLDAGI